MSEPKMTENKYLEMAKELCLKLLQSSTKNHEGIIATALESVANEAGKYTKPFGDAMNDYHQAYLKEQKKVDALEKQLSEKEAELQAIRKRFDERYATPNEYEEHLIAKPLHEKIASLEAEVARWQKEFGIAGRKVTTLSQKLEEAVELLKRETRQIDPSFENGGYKVFACCSSTADYKNKHREDCKVWNFLKELKHIGESDDLS